MAWTSFTRALWTAIPLLLLSYNASAAPLEKPSAASFYIPSIPYIHQNPEHPLTMFGGHLSADPDLSRASSTDVTPHLYFFMVKNRRTADRERIVFWFNGGPGCSSFDGAMMEVGPWRWDGKSEHDFYVKEGGWEEYTTMVFVDQPAGTGFSYTSTDKYVHTMDIAQQQLLTFLKNFYEVFPEYKHIDTYLAGESFAGQWIPYYADAILNSTLNIPLRGAAIGNGWIDPKVQYPAYLDYVTKTGLFEENSADWKEVKKVTDHCISEIEKTKGDTMTIDSCQKVLHTIMEFKTRTVNNKKMCINIYDIRLEDTAPACGMNWPPEMPQITNFLGRSEVVDALHASAHPGGWVECRPDVHVAFQERKLESSISVMPRVLSKIPVLIFAGDQDLICNYIGLENMIKALTWNGQTGLGTVQTQSWTVNAVPAGTWVTSRNLTYVKHIGTITKPIFVEEHNAIPTNVAPAKTPEQDKAMWEAYYNAGSAALVLVIVFLIIGTFVWCRVRRNRVQLPATRREGEDEDDTARQRKGKQRSEGESEPTIFEVGDSDEEDYKHSSIRK
ncbi:pheromone-processing carboxypeptidase KEX1 [Pholiota molesta]|nr:pheromone-processing carboxypeptidase KEX1 [Pholiota molesta]